MHTIILKPLIHKGAEQIGIYFPMLFSLNNLLSKNGAKWTNTHKCFYIPCTEEAYKKLEAAMEQKAIINKEALKEYLKERKKALKDKPVVMPWEKENTAKTPAIISKNNKQPIQSNKPQAIPATQISEGNKIQLQQFEQMLVLKAYSPNTIRTYKAEFVLLLQTIKNYAAEKLTADDIKRYLQKCIESGVKENSIHSRLNALKFYYEQVLKKEKFFFDIPRPKKPFILPKLLNETELVKLFNAITNRKHKAMLFAAYSAGLRVSEIVNLKLRDIDSKRMQIFIEHSKGKKDRYVNLSPVLLDILRKYIQEYKPAPKEWLFESEQTGSAYPTRTVQQIFSNAKKQAAIKKEVGVHSLRHSFATHLLDKGTDIKYIKELLGHFNIKTTERYLHVSHQKLVNIISPLDDLMGKESIEW